MVAQSKDQADEHCLGGDNDRDPELWPPIDQDGTADEQEGKDATPHAFARRLCRADADELEDALECD